MGAIQGEPPRLAPGSRFFQKWIGGDESRCRAKTFSSARGEFGPKVDLVAGLPFWTGRFNL